MHWFLFAFLCAVIIAAGRHLARDGEILAEKTGMGRTWIGAVLVAATTSLPELFAGVGAAAVFHLPEIAVADVLGSCMFNLFILSMMDAAGGAAPLSLRANPGHALSIGFGTLLVGLVGIGIAGRQAIPSLGWVGLMAPVLVVTYLISMRIVFRYEHRRSAGNAAEELHYGHIPLRTVALRYAAAALVVVAAAVFLPEAGAAIAADTGLEQGFVGTFFVAVATSLPEVSVSLAAVRMGSIDLAIGNVLGSNMFNVLILAIDDMMYRPGPILDAVSERQLIAVLAVLAMNGIALIGLTYQATQKRMVLAWDTFAIAVVYVAALILYVAS